MTPDGRTADTGAGSDPIDMVISRNDSFLHSLNTRNGTISTFRVKRDGSLDSTATLDGIPNSATGLAAR